MGFRKNTWNRAVNTVWIVPRSIWTWLRWIVDITKMALNTVLDLWIWVWKTCWSIKQAVLDSFNNGRRYKRLWKIPLSLVCILPMLWEWAVETLRWTWCNTVANTVNTIWNLCINEWNAIKYIRNPEDPMWYSILKTEGIDINPQNILANALMDK